MTGPGHIHTCKYLEPDASCSFLSKKTRTMLSTKFLIYFICAFTTEWKSIEKINND